MRINLSIIAIVSIFIVAGLYYNVVLNSPIIFGDEGFYATHARIVVNSGQLPIYNFEESKIFHRGFFKPPLFILTEAAALGLGGEFGLKLLIPIFSILTAFMIYIFLKKFSGAKAGLIAALMFLATPALITYGVLGYTDTLLGLIFICAMLFIYTAIRDGKTVNIILAGIFIGLAILTKITGPLLIVLLLAFWATQKFRNWSTLLIILAIAASIATPWFVRNLILFDGLCYGPFKCEAVIDVEIPEMKGLEFAGRIQEVGTEMGMMKMGILNFSRFAFGWAIPVLFLFGLVTIVKRRRAIDTFLILSVGIFILIFLFGAAARAEDTARFLVPAIPSIAIIGGLFVAEAYNYIRKYSTAIAVIFVIALISAAWIYGQGKLDTMIKVKQFSPGFLEGCDWIKANTPPDAVIFTIYSHHTSYKCERKATSLSGAPDKEEIQLTNNNTAYEHLKLHGFDYVYVQQFTVTMAPYRETISAAFLRYLETSPHFEKVYDNTDRYGQNGVRLYEIL